MNSGTTALLTTQYLDEADRLADTIAVIDHGHLIAEGTSDELKDQMGGDVLEVRILEVRPRGCRNPAFQGRAFFDRFLCDEFEDIVASRREWMTGHTD